MGGSMGSVVGERFVRGVETTHQAKGALHLLYRHGRYAPEEGLLSLMQMAKDQRGAEARLAKKACAHIRRADHFAGGVLSFAFVGDVVIAEPKALIGFAGPRVIRKHRA